MGSGIYQHEKPACKLLHLAKYIWNSNTQYFSSFPSFFWDFTKYLRRSFNFCYIQNFKTFAPPHKLGVTLLNLPNSFKWSSALKDKDDRWIMNFAPVFRLNTLLTKYWVKKDLNISHIMKMVKHNLKILQYLHRKIFKVCLSIFLSLFIKVTDYKWIFYLCYFNASQYWNKSIEIKWNIDPSRPVHFWKLCWMLWYLKRFYEGL